MPDDTKSLLQLFQDSTEDLVGRLLYYDRKDDEELSREDVDEMLTSGEVTKEMIVSWFAEELTSALKP